MFRRRKPLKRTKTLSIFTSRYDIISFFYDKYTLSLPEYANACNLIVKLANPSPKDIALDVACETAWIQNPKPEYSILYKPLHSNSSHKYHLRDGKWYIELHQ